MRTIVALLAKELVEIVRDPRTLFASLSFAFVGPVVLVAVVYGIAAASRPALPGPVAWCSGSARSLELERYLENTGYQWSAQAPVCLSVPQTFSARLAAGRAIEIGVRTDLVQHEAAAKRLASDLEAFGTSVGIDRLIARGVAPGVGHPLAVTLQNTAPASATANSVISILALFFVIAPFFVCLAAAIDTTAGERERGTLEPLMVQPVSAWRIVLAKWLSVSLLGIAGAALTVALGLWTLRQAPLADAGVALSLGPSTMVQAAAVVVPLALLVAALQIWIGLLAKTYKEGQNYLTAIAFLFMGLGMTAFKDTPERLSTLPVVHELVQVKALLAGAVAPAPSLPSAVIIAAAVAVFLALAAARLRRASLVHA